MLKNAIWLFIIAVVAFALFLPSYTQMQDLRSINEAHKAQIELLVRQNMTLNDELKRLDEDPDYIERIAREKMGLMKEGEVVYKIVPMRPPAE